ncbi:MAG: OmpA family protein [Humidesulfovibrio sp.]|uniref:OmpA family protein n=1 Tax=Humidesulfovibrio sp. TaxID=2910988 RepID=UPI0027FB442C|nr:OmpA family protein [Humidesulfovibrio sp.]MDQ7833841.1 OmpA family protein [Humidesulfovibrio sp.]
MRASRSLALPLFFLLCVLSVTACGKSRNVVLLLPDPDGHVGSVVVSNAQGSQTLTQAGTATRIAPKAAPSAPEVLSAEEQAQLFGPAQRALPTKAVRYILYFLSDGVQLTPESKADLPKVLATAKERQSRDISVVGHASKAGEESFNIELSRRRAEAVRKMLVKDGLAPDIFDVTSHGSSNPLVESSNPHEPKNRRVEITIR